MNNKSIQGFNFSNYDLSKMKPKELNELLKKANEIKSKKDAGNK